LARESTNWAGLDPVMLVQPDRLTAAAQASAVAARKRVIGMVVSPG
jgi:hypothetical protein